MKPITFRAPVNLQAAAGKSRRFRIEAYDGGPLPITGWPLPVIVDLRGLQASVSVPILIDHQNTVDHTLGQTDSIVNTGRELQIAGPITGVSPIVQQVLAQADAGHQWQASIGALVKEHELIPAGQRVNVNGQTFNGPVIVAWHSELRETTVTPAGAATRTAVNLAAAAAGLKGAIMSFEDWVKSLGLDPAALSPEAISALQLSFDQSQQAPATPAMAGASAAVGLDLKAMRKTGAAEFRRQADISRICGGTPLVAAAAIEHGWTPEQAELQMLKAQQRQSVNLPSNRTLSASVDLSPDMLKASLLLRAGHEKVAVKAFGERTVQQAHDLRIGNLRELCAASLSLSGRNRNEFRSEQEMVRAAFSTVSLPTILSDTVNRTLVSAYEETTSDWRTFANIGNAPDFRTQKDVRPAAVQGLEELGAGGVIKSNNLAEEDVYEWSVDTYAKMLMVDHKTIQNDDLGFIAQLSPMMGQAAGRSLLDLVWSTIMGGVTSGFFAGGNSNYVTGGTTALDVTSLGAGVTAMLNQKDSQNFNVGFRPAVLVVPPTLELTARPLLNSAELLGLSTSNTPSGNPVVNIVPNLIVEPRLENSSRFSNTSTKAWYLFGPPNSKPVTVGFLDGVQTPTVEVEDAPFNTLGMQMRVIFNYGVALSDPKAAYKAKGEA